MIDLAPHHLETVRRILKEHVPACEVRAFGSRVDWTAKDYSDLDLAVMGSGTLKTGVLGRLKEAFEESDLPFRVDVLDWHATSPEFQKVIEKQYEVIQGATNGGCSVAPGLSPAHAALKDGATSLGMVGDGEPIYGSLPNNWRMASVAQLIEEGEADVQTGPFGTMLHASAYQPEGTPVVAVKNIGDNRLIHDDIPRVGDATLKSLSRYQLQEGDILFGRKGAVERRAYVRADENGWLQGSDCIRLRLRGAVVNSRFLSLVLGSQAYRSWITQHAHGATMPSLNQEIVKRIPLPLPPQSEQQAIAHILGTLDDKIELNRRMNETLEAMARALFKSWFVDFDPVRAKAEGRDPGLPKPLADLFPDSLEKSALGIIPKGWHIAPLPDVIDINPTRSLRREAIAPYLDMANMPTQTHSPDVVVDRAFSSGMRFINGDTLVARITPCLENGKTAYVDFLNDGQVGWGSTEYIILRPKTPLPTEYAYCLARSSEFREFAIQSMTGSSGRQRVPVDSLSNFQIASPPKDVAVAFGRLVTPHFARAKSATEEGRVLAALRDTLLPKLISGELRVTEVHRFVEAQPQ